MAQAISKLKSKLISLCNNSSWKELGRVDLVNISSTTLSTVETEVLCFKLKFATGIKNHDMGQLIDINYRHYDSDFHKGFVQGIITASTNCQTDELTLPRRYLAALQTLSSNHNIIILPSDKGGGGMVMASVYNQKLTDLLDDNNTVSLYVLRIPTD